MGLWNGKAFVRRVVLFEIRSMLIAFLLSLVYELAHSPLYIFMDADTTWVKLYLIVHCLFRDLAPFLLGYHLEPEGWDDRLETGGLPARA